MDWCEVDEPPDPPYGHWILVGTDYGTLPEPVCQLCGSSEIEELPPTNDPEDPPDTTDGTDPQWHALGMPGPWAYVEGGGCGGCTDPTQPCATWANVGAAAARLLYTVRQSVTPSLPPGVFITDIDYTLSGLHDSGPTGCKVMQLTLIGYWTRSLLSY